MELAKVYQQRSAEFERRAARAFEPARREILKERAADLRTLARELADPAPARERPH